MGTLVANRLAKAYRLADVLRSHGATSAQVRELPEAGWSMVAELAGTKLPSPETQETVVSILLADERPAADDPFASFAKDRCG